MSRATTHGLWTNLRRTASCSHISTLRPLSSSSSSPSSSSTSKLDVQPKTALSADKMRVLVDLYHQSAEFITLDNLSYRIDDAFLYHSSTRMARHREAGPRLIKSAIVDRLMAPKFMPVLESHVADSGKQGKQGTNGEDWSQTRTMRQKALMMALYGLRDRGQPGYDALLERYEAENARKEQVALEDTDASMDDGARDGVREEAAMVQEEAGFEAQGTVKEEGTKEGARDEEVRKE